MWLLYCHPCSHSYLLTLTSRRPYAASQVPSLTRARSPTCRVAGGALHHILSCISGALSLSSITCLLYLRRLLPIRMFPSRRPRTVEHDPRMSLKRLAALSSARLLPAHMFPSRRPRTLVIGNWECGHVPRSRNVRSVPGTWEQSRSRSVKT
jgi:hypothetical protein